jgi:hypothetical protein
LEKEYRLLDTLESKYPQTAVIIKLDKKLLFGKDGKGPIPKEQFRQRLLKLREMLKKTSKYKNVLGYTVDEPENKLYKQYQKWKIRRDEGLAEWMTEQLKWVPEEIHKTHPNAYFMPLLAWWTTYKKSGEIYDVLMPAHYPETNMQIEKSRLHEVAYDARLAAEAVRANKKYSMIYVPPMFNRIFGKWAKMPEYKFNELRYTVYSPITLGAMGIVGWRLKRCSPQFAREKIFPLLKELHGLVPWLLGEPCSDKVSSTNKENSILITRKRVKMKGKEDAEFVRKTAAPACTYILRYNPKAKSYLLLAVNNQPGNMNTSFDLDKAGINDGMVKNIFSSKSAKINKGKMNLSFAPFEVKGFILKK